MELAEIVVVQGIRRRTTTCNKKKNGKGREKKLPGGRLWFSLIVHGGQYGKKKNLREPKGLTSNGNDAHA